MLKSRKAKWALHALRMERGEMNTNFQLVSLNRGELSKDVGVNAWILLKRILEKLGRRK
jgi:hypothetical protein